MIVSGYASVFNVRDKHLDTVSPVAFDEFLKSADLSEQLIPLMVAHEPPYVGYLTRAEVHEKRGLYAEFKIFSTHEEYVIELFSSGRNIGLSIGFETTRSDSHYTDEGEIRTIYGINLKEVSLVSHPSNPETWATISLKDRPSIFRTAALELMKLFSRRR
jgi:HK97 family phage prohead protease